MEETKPLYYRLHNRLLSEQTKERGEKLIIYISIISFVIHLALIFLNSAGILEIGAEASLFQSPISAIYTPFSFILIYEVYLLIYYLPQSITIYIGKQYEIITLIVIRRVFKDLGNLELSPNWFQIQNDLQFTYDLSATIILFLLIFCFLLLNKRSNTTENTEQDVVSPNIQQFIKMKHYISIALVPVFLLLALYSFGQWAFDTFLSTETVIYGLKDLNKIFFDEFFTVLILTDVVLLLFSFIHTDQFSKVIRNSGFIISTILIKISFGTEGLLNTALIVVAVFFGVTILGIHNLYERIEAPEEV
ncbi:hypothetical protein AB2B38_012925 [Balneola sp. MJW-20]|uniref:hypothetical protein n=1 Tax=Gracilimonas aurantiaca TaxID=3234185 RepID=UPI0034652363